MINDGTRNNSSPENRWTSHPMGLQEVVELFGGEYQPDQDTYRCYCPAHDDENPSLSIALGASGKVVLHCHAGCKPEKVLEAVGLTMADLNGVRPIPNIKAILARSFGFGEAVTTTIYDYRDADGRYLYSKVRFEGGELPEKQLRYAVISSDRTHFDTGRGNTPATLYNLPAMMKAAEAGETVYIVEGEKDVETLRERGFTATTAGSVSDWKPEFAQFFTGMRVVILPDNDDPGMDLKDQIETDLTPYAHSIKVCETSKVPHGDVTDYFVKENRSVDDFKAIVSASSEQLAPWLYRDNSGTIKTNADTLAYYISEGTPYLIVRHPDDERDSFYLYRRGKYISHKR